MIKFKSLEKWYLQGPKEPLVKVKTGDEICFISPEVLARRGEPSSVTSFVKKTAIPENGPGPFILLGIRRYPALVLLFFKNDHGEEIEINPGYLTKY